MGIIGIMGIRAVGTYYNCSHQKFKISRRTTPAKIVAQPSSHISRPPRFQG